MIILAKTSASSEYNKARKRLRNYLAQQEKSGIPISIKLPPVPKRATKLSTEKVNKLLEEAKEERKEYMTFVKEREDRINRYKNMPARDLAYEVASGRVSISYDRKTGEIVEAIPKSIPEDRLDTDEHIIETAVYDWSRNGTQTEYTQRIELFIETCISQFGKDVVATALRIMIDEQGLSLTRMERYNNDYAHDWIAETLEIIREIAYDKRLRESESKVTNIRKQFEEYFKEANEDNFNGQLDAEVYESRYEGRFKNISRTPWRFK